MIAASIHPDEIPLGQPTEVMLRLANTGPGTCTNVRFTFRMPREILLIRGRRQVQVARLKEGEHHDHLLQVQGKKQGDFRLVSTNFSYRDSTGRGRRVSEVVLSLRVVMPTEPIPAPVPVLDLKLETTRVPVDAWSPLSGHIANVGNVAVQEVTLSASGPALQSRKETLGDLPAGGTLDFTLSVYAAKVGARVPIQFKAAVQDSSGRLRDHSWRAHLAVEAIQLGISEREAATFELEVGRLVIKILFLAANPSDTTRLRLDEESRAIDQALRQAEFRDMFDIKQHWAVRVSDIQGLLLRHQPDIVHFSGHGGESSEIVLEDNYGNSRPVSVRALSQLFSVLKDNIRCVVLNACYSEQQARAIAQHIDCVIGMSESIGDSAAISFATAFYQALGYGRDVKTAFDLGCLQIDLENLNERDTPKLLALISDPEKLIFVNND